MSLGMTWRYLVTWWVLLILQDTSWYKNEIGKKKEGRKNGRYHPSKLRNRKRSVLKVP
jgi:hypothetical protein